MPVTGTQRLFFALWPDTQVRVRLAVVARQCAKRPVADANLHMTLLFLGQCSEQRRACFSQAASQIECEPFELQMDYLGGWSRAGIQWLGTSRIPDVLSGLVHNLAAALEPCGYQAEKRPFVPHVTLARKVRRPKTKAGLEAIRWSVQDFVLIESVAVEGGTRYDVLQRWPLGKNA